MVGYRTLALPSLNDVLSEFPTLLQTRITLEPGNSLVIGQKIWYSSKKSEVKGSVWSLSPCPRRSPNSVDPPTAASNTSTSIAGVAGEVSRKPGGTLLPCCFALLAEEVPPGHAEGKKDADAAALLS